jgi:hypothetical protein
MVQHLIRQRPWYPSPCTPWEILGEEFFEPEAVAKHTYRIWFSGHAYAITIKRLIETTTSARVRGAHPLALEDA